MAGSISSGLTFVAIILNALTDRIFCFTNNQITDA